MKSRLLLASLCVAFATFVAQAANGVPLVKKTRERPPLLKKGTLAPDFTAYKADGSAVKLSDYKGNVVLVDFWSTWCGPCKASMPHVESLHKKFGPKGLTVLGVCVWDRQEAFEKWQTSPEVATTYLKVFDRAGKAPDNIAATLYKVSGIPTFYLIDKDGTVLFAASGFGGPNDRRLDDALAQAGL